MLKQECFSKIVFFCTVFDSQTLQDMAQFLFLMASDLTWQCIHVERDLVIDAPAIHMFPFL